MAPMALMPPRVIDYINMPPMAPMPPRVIDYINMAPMAPMPPRVLETSPAPSDSTIASYS